VLLRVRQLDPLALPKPDSLVGWALGSEDRAALMPVIALYCGLASARAARDMIELLIAEDDTMILADVLAEAWLSSGPELARNAELRRAVLLRIAAAPVSSASTSALSRFDSREVAGIAWQALGGSRSQINLSHAFVWCRDQGEISPGYLLDRLKAFESLTPMSLSELIYIMHASFPIECLRELTRFTPTAAYGAIDRGLLSWSRLQGRRQHDQR